MIPAQHKEQRVAVFVDVQNMYYSAKNLYGAKVDFGKVLASGVAGRKLVRAFAYVIRADVGAEKDFFGALQKIGYEVKEKDLQVFLGGAKKGDWDVGLCMDAVRLVSKMDAMVLVSGDGDYTDLLEYARSQGVRTEVIAFGKTTSSRLFNEADFVVDMDQTPEKYLIGKINRPKFSIISIKDNKKDDDGNTK
ncbi:MAG: NYN domain-containing protein [Patescibacteria group bacterium]|nr:NYN domain-containing protein [Patescibacteria group bacterium]MBU1953145.1 NYN domain-containing protein [Patescibacteria group bacterium]